MSGTLVRRLLKLFAAMAVLASGLSADTLYVTASGTLCLMTCAPDSGLDFPVVSFQASFSVDPSLLLDTRTETLTDFNADISPIPGEGDAGGGCASGGHDNAFGALSGLFGPLREYRHR